MGESRPVLVDTSAWTYYFRYDRRPEPAQRVLAEQVRALVETGGAWIHPVVAGEVLLGGVDPYDAFDGLPWLAADSSDRRVLEWLVEVPCDWRRGVGWADSRIVHSAAVEYAMDLVTGDRDQLAFYQRVLGTGTA